MENFAYTGCKIPVKLFWKLLINIQVFLLDFVGSLSSTSGWLKVGWVEVMQNTFISWAFLFGYGLQKICTRKKSPLSSCKVAEISQKWESNRWPLLPVWFNNWNAFDINFNGNDSN